MNYRLHYLAPLAGLFLLAGCATQGREQPAPVPELKPGRLIGYLPIKERIDSKAILPAPPSTPAETATDEAISRAALSLKGSERWKLAARDAGSFRLGGKLLRCRTFHRRQDPPGAGNLQRVTSLDC